MLKFGFLLITESGLLCFWRELVQWAPGSSWCSGPRVPPSAPGSSWCSGPRVPPGAVGPGFLLVQWAPGSSWCSGPRVPPGAVGPGFLLVQCSSWCRTVPLMWPECVGGSLMRKALMPMTHNPVPLTVIQLSTYGTLCIGASNRIQALGVHIHYWVTLGVFFYFDFRCGCESSPQWVDDVGFHWPLLRHFVLNKLQNVHQ